MIYRKQKRNKAAMDYFEEAIKNLKYQDQYNAYIERGICYRDTNLIENSINDFLKAL
jgi:Tfp pilus assembly protein PilF